MRIGLFGYSWLDAVSALSATTLITAARDNRTAANELNVKSSFLHDSWVIGSHVGHGAIWMSVINREGKLGRGCDADNVAGNSIS